MYGLILETKGGKRRNKYCGTKPLTILKYIMSLCLSLLVFKIKKKTRFRQYNNSWLVPRIRPVMVLRELLNEDFLVGLLVSVCTAIIQDIGIIKNGGERTIYT